MTFTFVFELNQITELQSKTNLRKTDPTLTDPCLLLLTPLKSQPAHPTPRSIVTRVLTEPLSYIQVVHYLLNISIFYRPIEPSYLYVILIINQT